MADRLICRTPLVLLLILAVCGIRVSAVRAQGGAPSDGQEVIAVTEKLFDAMRARDAAVLRALLHDEARIIAVRSTGEVTIRSKNQWIRTIAGSSNVLDERMREPEVRVDGHLATLWAPYVFRRGEALTHCGVDAFQYVRTAGEWRLITLAFTSRTTGCESLAPLAETPSIAPPVPAPGELIDLGGWRVHLHCTGQGSPSQPAVILEAGAGGFSVDWSLVQPEVARFARMCSYDRAGLAWSDLGPRPRTLRQITWELHTLLDKAGAGKQVIARQSGHQILMSEPALVVTAIRDVLAATRR